jgi:sialate O-acetylesterase
MCTIGRIDSQKVPGQVLFLNQGLFSGGRRRKLGPANSRSAGRLLIHPREPFTMRRSILACLCLFLLCAAAPAEVRLPALISDHMVVQRERPIHIWGWAEPGERVRVALNNDNADDTTDAAGRWSVYLPPQNAGGPYDMTVEGTNSLTISDVLVGEVWVGSGQSNMEFSVERANAADKEIAEAQHPQIRLFKVERDTAHAPLNDVKGAWQVCTPESVKSFSAVSYFFARDMHQKTGVPFGAIQSAWGGTPAQSWVSPLGMAEDPWFIRFRLRWARTLQAYPLATQGYEYARERWEAEAEKQRKLGKEPRPGPRPPMGPLHPHQPSALYNAMIAPLTPFVVRGVLWYQGESNAESADGFEYRHLFRALIEDWRQQWSLGDFPFLFVQLANYARVGGNSQWPELREAQTMALSLRNTAMAVSIDIGEPHDIHPRNKQEVGRRLALAARAITHGEHGLVYSGPIFRQAAQEGSRLRLWFDHVGGGLQAKGPLAGFEVTGPDGKWKPAEARIEGESILVSAPGIAYPVAARYGWAPDPKAVLFNAEGLPAAPFRTLDRM